MWYVFGVFGLLAVFFGLKKTILGLCSKGWPTTNGTVLSSEVDIRPYDKKRKQNNPAKYPKVVYSFDVNGEHFESSQISCNDHGDSNSSHASGIVKRYPVGKKVTVYFSPKNPKRALLEPGFSWAGVIAFLFGLGMVTLSVLGILDMLK